MRYSARKHVLDVRLQLHGTILAMRCRSHASVLALYAHIQHTAAVYASFLQQPISFNFHWQIIPRSSTDQTSSNHSAIRIIRGNPESLREPRTWNDDNMLSFQTARCLGSYRAWLHLSNSDVFSFAQTRLLQSRLHARNRVTTCLLSWKPPLSEP
jgi:hypothetical protein